VQVRCQSAEKTELGRGGHQLIWSVVVESAGVGVESLGGEHLADVNLLESVLGDLVLDEHECVTVVMKQRAGGGCGPEIGAVAAGGVRGAVGVHADEVGVTDHHARRGHLQAVHPRQRLPSQLSTAHAPPAKNILQGEDCRLLRCPARPARVGRRKNHYNRVSALSG